MNKDAYRILTEKVSFPGLHRLIRNAVVLCWKEKKRKAKLCGRKGKQAPKTLLRGKKKGKIGQIHLTCFKHLLNAKQILQGEKRGKHVFHEREKRLKIFCKTKMLIFLVSHLHLSRSQQQAEPGGPRHSLGSGAATSGLGFLAKPAQLEPPRLSSSESRSECNCVIEAKKPR